jgi:hypothetical protein
MNKRFRPWLLLAAVFLLVPGLATAQRSGRPSFGPFIPPVAPVKRSHHELPGGPELDANGELMADRLKELHELHQLQDQVQDLLKDPDFVNNIKNQFSEEQLRQLREKLLKGSGLAGDESWNKLLQQAASRQKLDERQIDLLRRWAERAEKQQIATPDVPGLLNGRPSPTPPQPEGVNPPAASPTSSPGQGEEVSLWRRLQEGTSNWISEHVDGLGGDIINALTELAETEEGAPLAELLRKMKQPDFSSGPLIEEAAGLSRYLPEIGEFLHEQRGAWDEIRSIFEHAPVPSLPGMGSSPSAPSGASLGEGEGWGTGLVALVAMGGLLLLVWKMAGRMKAEGRDTAEEWRLGPWPVAPSAVSSREELIRAFEHLVLLCLGPSSAACHHHELAERLAQRETDQPARRRQAAERLADLYEQARYAPPTEPLSADQLGDARDALSFLAGVTAA